MNGKFFGGIVAMVLVMALFACIGATAYQFGVMQGLAEGGRWVAPPVSTTPPVGAPYYYYGGGWHQPWGFGFLGCLFPLFGLLLFFVLLRGLFFRRWAWGMHRGKHWEHGAPPFFEEWHRRAHGEQPSKSEETPAKE